MSKRRRRIPAKAGRIQPSGTRGQIQGHRWGSSGDSEEPRIRIAEPPHSMKHRQTTKQKSSQPVAAAPIPNAKTPAEKAREAAGYDLEGAAERLRVGKRYLRGIELKGRAPLIFAERAARLYGCRISVFLFTPAGLAKGAVGSPSAGRAHVSAAATAGNSQRPRLRHYPDLRKI